MRHEFDCDFMAIGAHADDVELGCGGSLLKMLEAGKKGVIVDLTTASAGTRGNSAIRLQESMEAAALMHGVERLNLGLPDAHLKNDEKSQGKLIACIRKFRPRLLITHCEKDYHPDHNAAHQLVKDCWYKAGLRALYQDLPAFRPHRLVFFIGGQQQKADFVVDITGQYERKKEIIACYKSQFKVPGSEEFEGVNYLSSGGFLEDLEIRSKGWGKEIRVQYGEGFQMEEGIEVQSLADLSGETY